MEKYDFSGWATRNDLLCVDGRTIKKDAFKNQNGKTVPLVWGHTHSDPNRVLGHAVLENRDEGVYAYCSFNDSESGLAAKKLVKHGDVRSLSICAGQLKQAGANVVHGVIYELSLVLAGANPGAFIDSVMEHGDASEDRMIIGYDENIMIYHSADEKEEKSETQEGKTSEEKTEEDEETVEQIFDTLSEKQKNVIYAMFGQAFGEPDKPEDKNDDSKGGKTEMNNNTSEMAAWRENAQALFDEWFQQLKDTLSENVEANLANQILELQERTKILEEIVEGIRTEFTVYNKLYDNGYENHDKLLDSSDGTIIDSDIEPIVARAYSSSLILDSNGQPIDGRVIFCIR